MTTRDQQPIQTLHLNDRDKAKLLWAIEQTSQQEASEHKRRLRIGCSNHEAVLTLKSDSGGQTQLAVLARNLSRHGIALVHGRYVHPDTRGSVAVESKNGAIHEIPCVVRHVRHVQGMVHELGVVFDEPIELSDFVSMSQAEETRYMRELADEAPDTEENDVSQLVSRVLVVDDFSCDRKLFSHWLTQSGLEVNTAVDHRSAIVQVQEQFFDLLVIDICLGEEDGIALIRELRDSQVVSPILVVSSEEAPATREEVQAAGGNEFLKKPFNQDTLVETAYRMIGVDPSNDLTPIFSEFREDSEMRPLLTEFVRKLKGYIEELREANNQTNYDSVAMLSKQLRGAGDSYGFPLISELSGLLIDTMEQDAVDAESIRQATNELIAGLNRVKLG